MAGNIIPAIATTNAIVGGLIVMEAVNVIAGTLDKCRTVCNHMSTQWPGLVAHIGWMADAHSPNPCLANLPIPYAADLCVEACQPA
jgi:hypothetical protein